MFRFKFFIVISLFVINNISAQEKPLWEGLNCDSNSVVNENINTRSIVLNIIQKKNINLGKYKNVLIGIIRENKNIIWQSLDKENNLDSLSQQYLKLLISNGNTLYKVWQPWLDKDRDIFVQKRDSLIKFYSQSFPNLKIKVISDLRTRENQSEILKKGNSLANLSFHEWGLASDFAIYKHNKLSKNIKHYILIDSIAQKYGLRWGGKFVGFVDYPHVQLYYNGAELLRRHPYLAIEYEFFYLQNLQRVRDKIAKNLEFEIEDSKELLMELNKLRKKEVCYCFKNNIEIENFQPPEYYNSNDDILILVDEVKKEMTLKIPYQTAELYKFGNWK